MCWSSDRIGRWANETVRRENAVSRTTSFGSIVISRTSNDFQYEPRVSSRPAMHPRSQLILSLINRLHFRTTFNSDVN